MAFNIYEVITQRIIEQLEKGTIPWRKTWIGSEPINYTTRKPYRGVNLLLLPFGGEWLTYRQARDCGGYVKKDEKSSMIVFYKMIEKKTDDDEKEAYPYLQYSNVFHVSQCEGINSKLEAIKPDIIIKPIDTAQGIFDGYTTRSGVRVMHVEGSNRAAYSPGDDTITLPVIGQFLSAEEYYSTSFHEAAHSTGHRSRLDRLSKPAAFGSGDYSREELVADVDTH